MHTTTPVTNAEADVLISIDGLRVSYKPGEYAIGDISLDIRRGEFVCILGPSGCGKSTLLHVLSGLMHPKDGEVKVNGRDFGDPGDHTTSRVGYVFQDHRLLLWRTVRQNLEITLQGAGTPRARWDDLIDEALAMVEIQEFAHAWPLQLSGGQRQRVAIARALVIEPAYMLMDEPYSTLDEVTGRTMRQELLRVWRESGKTIVFVTHSIREAVFLADRIVVLTRGPGHVLQTVDVDLPRPRDYESAELARLEQMIINTALENWGIPDA